MKRASERKFDVIILGGGPAGLAAALWCSELGLTSMILERQSELGGQLHWIHVPIQNYPGLEAENGPALLEKIMISLRSRNFEVTTDALIERADLRTKRIYLSTGEKFQAKALIIATGVRRRKLGVEGEDYYMGRGILNTGQTDREALRGKTLLIVGGGDAAFENAFNLSAYAKKTYLFHRRSDFSARPEFVERVLKKSNVEVITNVEVTRLGGNEELDIVWYTNNITKGTAELYIDALLVRIGVEPNLALFRNRVNTDNKGYILVDHTCQTSRDHIFAVGDIANPLSPTISTAMGTGSTAVKTIFHSFQTQT